MSPRDFNEDKEQRRNEGADDEDGEQNQNLKKWV